MLEKGIAPSIYTYNALINSCAQRGDVEGAVKWLERMRPDILPSAVSYNAVIKACANAQPNPRAAEAEHFFREMREAELVVSAITLSALDKAIGVDRRTALCQALGVNVDKAAAVRNIDSKHRTVDL